MNGCRSAILSKTVFDLRGKTVGIVGYGSIGRETGRLAESFGMEVLALKRDPHDHADPGWCAPNVGDPEGRIPKRWFGPEQRRELMALSQTYRRDAAADT